MFDCLRVLVFLALNLQHFLFQPEKKIVLKQECFSFFLCRERQWYSAELLTGMCDGETVGGLQVVNIVIEVEGFLCHILVGVIQLDSKPEGAVFLHCGAHEQSAYGKQNVT